MRRHASADELADLAAGELKARKTARITAHVASCPRCGQLSRELNGVSVLLASVTFPAMPADLSSRIETALAAEASRRLAGEPVSEADRLALPTTNIGGVRAGRRAVRLRSPMALRLLAAACAVVVVGGGAYALARGGATSAGRTSAAAPSTRHGPALGLGPQLSWARAGHTETVRAVNSETNFVPAKLTSQATAAVSTAEQRGLVHPQKSGLAQPFSAAPGNLNVPAPTPSATPSPLSGCVAHFVGSQAVLLVELAKFQGAPAVIIIIGTEVGLAGQVWVVGAGCTAAHPDVLDHQALQHT